MDDPGGVRLGEAIRGLRREGEQPSKIQRARGHELSECSALDQLHRDERRPVLRSDLVDRDDVGMVQRRRRPRFLLEAGQALRVPGELRRKHLDRDDARELVVPRPIDLTHAAGAQRREDLVRSDSGTRGERHQARLRPILTRPF